MIVLSPLHAAPLLAAHRAALPTVEASPDLGLTLVHTRLTADAVHFSEEDPVPWAAIDTVCRHADRNPAGGSPCYIIRKGEAERVTVFSEHTGRVCSLAATAGAPTIVIAGFPMHRIQGTDPLRDTRLKLRRLGHVTGRVLDTTTGLGYTAIEAARTASEVVTVELDPAVLAIARLNPWSRPLFESKAITQHVGDSAAIIERFSDDSFARVVHDPPTVALAGDLYSGAFYRQLHRVLKRGGRLFHYVADPRSPAGRRTLSGVTRRLREAGFTRVQERPEAFGVVATT